MPNHCGNTLILPEDALSAIVDKYVRKDGHGEKVFDFELVIPVGEVPDWYERRVEKWGTKWIGYDLSVGETELRFLTAWSPPIPIIGKLAELHRDTEFRLEYHEPGMGFCGVATAKWHDGEVLINDDYRDMTDEDFEKLGFM